MRQRFGQQRLAAAGRPDQQNVALRQLDVTALAAVTAAVLQPLVVIVNRDRKDFFGAFLTDYVLVQDVFDLVGLGQLVASLLRMIFELLANYVITEFDTFVTNKDGRAGN